MTGEVVLETQGLAKRFGDLQAVQDLNLQIRQGDVYGFLGPNGAGKTTSIRMILGLISPSAGATRIFGHDIRRQFRQAIRQVGAMVEGPAFYPYLTGRQNLKIYGRLSGGVSDSRIQEVLEMVGLGRWGEAKVKGYSQGMRQRLGIAQALLHGPKLLILDEPTNGLDPPARLRMIQLIQEVRDRGDLRLIVSSHLLRDVEECCDEVLILKDGNIAAFCNLEEERRANRRFLEIETRGGPNGCFLEAMEKLGCETAEGAPGRIKLILPDGLEVRRLYEVAAQQNVQIRRLNHKRDSLEDIFLKAMEAANGRV